MDPLCAREYYELDMSQRDEREVAKMLVRLADDEPVGRTQLYKRFWRRWKSMAHSLIQFNSRTLAKCFLGRKLAWGDFWVDEGGSSAGVGA